MIRKVCQSERLISFDILTFVDLFSKFPGLPHSTTLTSFQRVYGYGFIEVYHLSTVIAVHINDFYFLQKFLANHILSPDLYWQAVMFVYFRIITLEKVFFVLLFILLYFKFNFFIAFSIVFCIFLTKLNSFSYFSLFLIHDE